MKALIVDDSRTMRRIIAGYLRQMEADIEVVEADHGKTALEALEKHQDINVIFLDWNMPVMSGIDCLRALRHNGQYDGVCVCMVTSESEQTNVATALDAGANEYLMKPFTKEALQEKLQMVIGAL